MSPISQTGECYKLFSEFLSSIQDLNECNGTTAVCNDNIESCENTEGGYKCNCLPGYRKVDGVCRGKHVHPVDPYVHSYLSDI